MGHPIHTGISYMYEPEFNRAILPLLQSGEIDALEWSFDTVKNLAELPEWTNSLLKEFASADRLYGHGVHYSLLSGGWHERHSVWLHHLKEVVAEYHFQHISEHFGFMTSTDAHRGAPLPLPYTPDILALGIERLKILKEAVGDIPVGVENLALAFSLRNVTEHGPFLDALVQPIEGFILLDLHNIYCQAMNFSIDPQTILDQYPLHLVKEIHVSGGSWESSIYSDRPVRRDTHDEAIPEAVFQLLEEVLPICPNTEVVIVERLGNTLKNEAEEALFRDDFLRVKRMVSASEQNHRMLWSTIGKGDVNASQFTRANTRLETQQQLILNVLRRSENASTAHQNLLNHPKIDHDLWDSKSWDLKMIEIAMRLGKKWGTDHPINAGE